MSGIIALIGVLCLSVGVGWYSPPAGLAVFGVMLWLDAAILRGKHGRNHRSV